MNTAFDGSANGAPVVNAPPAKQGVSGSLATDTITVLSCETGTAVKTFDGNNVYPYSAGRLFRNMELPCASLAELHKTLVLIEKWSDAFVIRGEPLDRSKANLPMLRRASGTRATFREVPRHWLMLDIDNVIAPAGIDPVSVDAIEHVVGLLPSEFKGVSYISQWSGSAGMKPGRIKLHLWYWLEEALGSPELRAWAKGLALLPTGRRLIDPAPFSVVQPHYTARPLCCGGDDPIPHRMRFVALPKDAVRLEVKKPHAESVN